MPVVGPIGLSPTPSVEASPALTPPAAPPSAAVSANPIDPAAPLTVVGSNWAPNETVTILLRDPAQPSAPLLLLGTAQADVNGLVVVSVTYPAEPRWANLNQADVIIQSQTTNVYAAVSITVQPLPATPEPGVTLVPTRAPPTHDADLRPYAGTANDTVINARVVDCDPDARAAHSDACAAHADTHASHLSRLVWRILC